MREKEDLQEILEKEFKWFHENPELSFEEYETTKRIKEILKRENIENTGYSFENRGSCNSKRKRRRTCHCS